MENEAVVSHLTEFPYPPFSAYSAISWMDIYVRTYSKKELHNIPSPTPLLNSPTSPSLASESRDRLTYCLNDQPTLSTTQLCGFSLCLAFSAWVFVLAHISSVAQKCFVFSDVTCSDYYLGRRSTTTTRQTDSSGADKLILSNQTKQSTISTNWSYNITNDDRIYTQ